MRRGVITGSVLAALLALATAASAQHLRIGIASDPDALDPTLSRSISGRQVFAAMCDKLVDIDTKLDFVPQLATGWQWSDEGRTLTLTLRQGVRFHDGETMTAGAVKGSLDRHLRMSGSARRSELGPIREIEASEPDRVAIRLSEPFVPLLAALSDRAGMIMSPRAIETLGERFATQPACAGPFRLVRRVALDRLELERFPEYWDAARIHVARLTYLPIPDGMVRVNNLRAEALDLIERVVPSDLATLRADPRLRVANGPSLASIYVAFNIANGPRAEAPIGRHARLREAFELAIDREALVRVAFEGAFQPGNQSVPPDNPFFARAHPVPGRDLARARLLVREAGFERVKLQMIVPITSDFRQAAEVIQAMVAEAGFDLELRATEGSTLLRDWTTGQFEALIVQWSGRTDLDSNLYPFNACDGALNGGKYCNAELDRLFKQGRSAVDQAARLQAYDAAARIYLADRPYVYLWHPTTIFALSAKLEGLRVVPDGMMRIQDLRLRP